MRPELLEFLSNYKKEYNLAITTKDYALLSQLSRQELPISEEIPAHGLVVKYFSIKAEILTMYGDFEKVEEILVSGEKYCESSQLQLYYLNWALNYFPLIKSRVRDEKKVDAANKAIRVLNKIKSQSDDANYYFFISRCLFAFYKLVAGIDQSEIAKGLHELKFKPVPLKAITEVSSQKVLFSNIFKGIAVAIELRDRELLEKMLKVISFDDQVLYSETNLFIKFQKTLADLIDVRVEFKSDFESLYQNANKFASSFPYFGMMINALQKQDFKALNILFASFK